MDYVTLVSIVRPVLKFQILRMVPLAMYAILVVSVSMARSKAHLARRELIIPIIKARVGKIVWPAFPESIVQEVIWELRLVIVKLVTIVL
jgi:hypothetical protein